MIKLPSCCVCVLLLGAHLGQCQDVEEVKKAALQSILRIENYPAMSAKGTYENFSLTLTTTSYFARGNQVWYESDPFVKNVADQSIDEQRQNRADERRIYGCDLPKIHAFDGKKAYVFVPSGLRLSIEPQRAMQADSAFRSMLPKYWRTFGPSEVSTFRHLLEGKTQSPKVESLGDGRWKFSQTGLGNPDSKYKVAIRDRFLIVDSKVDYHVTSYEGRGGMGVLTGELDWEKQDGNWYVKHGKHESNGKIDCEWNITEISFDALKCRARFDDLESVVPFGTVIRVKDESGNQEVRYKGGKAGEEEHQLRQLAMRNFRKAKE